MLTSPERYIFYEDPALSVHILGLFKAASPHFLIAARPCCASPATFSIISGHPGFEIQDYTCVPNLCSCKHPASFGTPCGNFQVLLHAGLLTLLGHHPVSSCTDRLPLASAPLTDRPPPFSHIQYLSSAARGQ